MALFPAQEIEAAFVEFMAAAARSAQTGDWTIWGERITPDATFVETELGRFAKREAIVRAISAATPSDGPTPWGEIHHFPVEDVVIDDNRGWVWALFWARFRDPGAGGLHQARVFLLLKYAGDGRFFYGETIYNPFHFERVLAEWSAARVEWEQIADERLAILAAREAQAREMAPLEAPR